MHSAKKQLILQQPLKTISLMAQMFQVHINTSWQDTATMGGGRSSVPTNEEGLHDGLCSFAAGIAAFQL